MKASYHSHPVGVHLFLGLLKGAELQRPANSHSGVVYEHVDAPLLLQDLLNRAAAVFVALHVGLDVVHALDGFGIPAMSAVYCMAVFA